MIAGTTLEGATQPGSAPLVPKLSSALLDIQAGEPSRGTRWVLWAVCALFAALLAWSLLAHLDIVAVAEGRLVPQTYTKIVQPLEGGSIKEILVKEGDEVKAGQVLLRLDETLVGAEGRSVNQELELRQLQLRRIDAELADRPMTYNGATNSEMAAKVEAQYRANRQALRDALGEATASRDKASADLAGAEETRDMLIKSLPSYERSAAAYEDLANHSLAPRQQALEKRREAIEKAQALAAQRQTVESLDAAVRAEGQKFKQIMSAYRSKLQTERSDTLSQVQKLSEESIKQRYRGEHLELKSPQDGTVKDIATTTLGAVVQPGTVLMTVVPKNEALIAEVQIKNEDVGFVEVGQVARIKVAAFPFQKYGMLEGRVINVGAEASKPENHAPTNSDESIGNSQPYKASVHVDSRQMPASISALGLRAGMQVMAEIHQGDRTVFEYLLSPVQQVLSESGRQR